jgi:hypothetical protein
MLTLRYPAALSRTGESCVMYLSRHDLAALYAGHALDTGISMADGLPIVLALGDKDDAETERVLSVGKDAPLG